MSMRDFMTRMLNTSRVVAEIAPPIVMETTPRVVVETAPPIVVEDGFDPLPSPEEPFYWDIESRSAAVLGSGKQSVGARAYAEHPTTEVLCVSFARGNGPIETWVPGKPIPEVVRAAAADPDCPWVAHGAAFERAMLEAILAPQHHWPVVPVERHVCTMSLALAHSYPGSLEGLAKILGLVNQKDVAREKIIRVMWKPRKPRPGEDTTQIYWVDTPELRVDLYIYNRQDVAVEREGHQHPKLTALPASEQDTWVLDAEINDHGVLIDAPLAAAASRLAAQALADLNERMRQETDGAVDTATKNEKLKVWVASQGVELPRKQRKGKSGLQWKASLDASDIEQLLAGDLPNPRVRSALEIRLQAAQSAASKIDRMLQTRCADGRVRGLFRFHGATTGRWSGAGFQPQNLKRPEIIKTDEAIAEAIQLVKAEDHTALKERYNDVLGVIGDLCRSMIVPRRGIVLSSGISARSRRACWPSSPATRTNSKLFGNSISASGETFIASRPSRFSGSLTCRTNRQSGSSEKYSSSGSGTRWEPTGCWPRSSRPTFPTLRPLPRGRGTMGAGMARQEPAHRRILGAARCGRGGGGAQS